MKQKIKYNINNYGIFIIALLVCVIIYKFANPIIAKLFDSKNIDKLFQSTITCTSIILGFSGTLITQILLSKREMDKNTSKEHNIKDNIFYWFFQVTNPKQIVSTVFVGIISCVVLIAASSTMLITDILDTNIKVVCFCVWLFFVIIFFYYIINLYYLFITLLFSSNEKQSSIDNGESETDIQNCMDAINNQGKSR